MRQSTSRILMIRPSNFRKNEQTADNSFQSPLDLDAGLAHERADQEFHRLAHSMMDKGIEVLVCDAPEGKDTPDALFPNNWVSFHSNGKVALYPMKAKNRRAERNEHVLTQVSNEFGLLQEELVDFTEFESHEVFLEGTGSVVLDRVHKKAYCCLSERSDRGAFDRFCDTMGFKGVVFHAYAAPQESASPVYHTNVVMSVGSHFAVLCAEAIPSDLEKENVMAELRENEKEILFITLEQMANFAGNILEVLNEEGLSFIVMSDRARNAFTAEQITSLEKFGEIISSDLTTIETLGGGSARCMLCEVFLPKL